MSMILTALETANPVPYVTQEEAFRFFDENVPLEPDVRALYRRILCEGPIAGCYVGVERYADAIDENQDRLVERFRVQGRAVAANAAQRALARAGLAAGDVDVLVVNTCTGYLCPGLSSYLAEDLGLREDVKAVDLMGMGCGAAIPNLECAAGILERSGREHALSVAVEICTATTFLGPDPGLIVSNCIFGDGAAAAVLRRSPEAPGSTAPQARLLDFESGLFPRYREDLRYRTEEGRLRNVLGKRVPVIGARTVEAVVRRLLRRVGLGSEEVNWWAVHPGGTAVLDCVRERLGLPPERLAHSYAVFREYGNMSSPTVLFVLQRILADPSCGAGQLGVVVSFGAGFTAFAALVAFE